MRAAFADCIAFSGCGTEKKAYLQEGMGNA